MGHDVRRLLQQQGLIADLRCDWQTLTPPEIGLRQWRLVCVRQRRMSCARETVHNNHAVPLGVEHSDTAGQSSATFFEAALLSAMVVTDVIDIRKRKFLVKYDFSDNLLCQLCKNCNDIVCYTVSVFYSLVKFSAMSMYHNCFHSRFTIGFW